MIHAKSGFAASYGETPDSAVGNLGSSTGVQDNYFVWERRLPFLFMSLPSALLVSCTEVQLQTGSRFSSPAVLTYKISSVGKVRHSL